MTKKKEKKAEKEFSFPKKYIYITRGIFIIIAIITFFIYGFYFNGFISLWENLKNATTILKYILIFFIIFLIILIIFNLKIKSVKKYDTTDIIEFENNSILEKDKEYVKSIKNVNSANNGIKYLVMFVLFSFCLLVFCSLLEFLLPILVIYVGLFIMYLIIVKIISYNYKKHND